MADMAADVVSGLAMLLFFLPSFRRRSAQ